MSSWIGDRQVAGVARQRWRRRRRGCRRRCRRRRRAGRRRRRAARGVRAHPARRREAVVDGGREAMLRAHPVVDRDDRAAASRCRAAGTARRGCRGRRSSSRRRGSRRAPAAAPRVAGAGAAAGRGAAGCAPCGPSAAASRTSSDLGRRRLGERAPIAVEGARLDRAQRVHRRQAALRDEVEQGAGVGVEHGVSSAAAFAMVADRPA